MTTTKTPNIALVSLKLPKPVPALITYAGGMVKAMTGNASFPNPTPTLAAITQAIADLQAAETTALARTKGAVSVRNEKQAALVALLKQLGRYIQATADAGADSGGSIILSAGVAVRKSPTRAPRVFHAAAGAVSGSAKLVAASAGHRSSYEWQYSIDGGKTWVPAAVTLKASTTVAGLAPGATAQFRYRPVTKTGEGDWSQAVSLIVK
jgi:hypothetical protein